MHKNMANAQFFFVKFVRLLKNIIIWILYSIWEQNLAIYPYGSDTKQKYTYIYLVYIYMLIKGSKYIQTTSKVVQFPSLATDKSTILTQANNAAT